MSYGCDSTRTVHGSSTSLCPRLLGRGFADGSVYLVYLLDLDCMRICRRLRKACVCLTQIGEVLTSPSYGNGSVVASSTFFRLPVVVFPLPSLVVRTG